MPRFNMTWLSHLPHHLNALLSGEAMRLEAALPGSTYTQFQQYVDKGYVLSVVANKMKIPSRYTSTPNIRAMYYNMPAKSVGPNPYVKVSPPVDEVERYANQKGKEETRLHASVS